MRAVNEIDMALMDVRSDSVAVRLFLPRLRIGRHGLTGRRIEYKKLPVRKQSHSRTIEHVHRQRLWRGISNDALLALPDNLARILIQSQPSVTHIVDDDIPHDRWRSREAPPGLLRSVLLSRSLPNLLTRIGIETVNMAELANRVDLPLMNCRRRTRTTRMLTRFKRARIVECPLLLTGLRVQTVDDVSRFLLVLFCPVVAHCVDKAVDNAERAHARPDICLPDLGSRRCVELLEPRLQIEMGTQVVGPILHVLRAHRNRHHQEKNNATTPKTVVINSLEPSHNILLLQDLILPVFGVSLPQPITLSCTGLIGGPPCRLPFSCEPQLCTHTLTLGNS